MIDLLNQLKMCRTTQKKVSWKARTPKFPFFFLHQMDNRTTWFRFIQRIIPEAEKRSKGSRAWSYQFWFSLGVKEKVISCTETHVRSLGILASEWNFNLSSRKINKTTTTTKWQKKKKRNRNHAITLTRCQQITEWFRCLSIIRFGSCFSDFFHHFGVRKSIHLIMLFWSL